MFGHSAKALDVLSAQPLLQCIDVSSAVTAPIAIARGKIERNVSSPGLEYSARVREIEPFWPLNFSDSASIHSALAAVIHSL
jgi:hypothetical protein